MPECRASHSFNYHEYYGGPKDHEYERELYGMTVYVSKVGGGTVGEKYVGAWAYLVMIDGREVAHGDDMPTGLPHTHEHVTQMVADFVSE
jgi:hypothetical protein